MKRSTFFKSLATLLGVAIVAPMELFKKKDSDFVTAVDPYDCRNINIGKKVELPKDFMHYEDVGVIDKVGICRPLCRIDEYEKLQNAIMELPPSGKMVDGVWFGKPKGYAINWDAVIELRDKTGISAKEIISILTKNIS